MIYIVNSCLIPYRYQGNVHVSDISLDEVKQCLQGEYVICIKHKLTLRILERLLGRNFDYDRQMKKVFSVFYGDYDINYVGMDVGLRDIFIVFQLLVPFNDKIFTFKTDELRSIYPGLVSFKKFEFVGIGG